MNNVKNDKYYISKIIADLRFICEHMANESYISFNENELLSDSMNFRLIQIQENSKKISDEFKRVNQSIPWSDIAGLRNRLVHDYGNIDMGVVFNTLKYDIPELLQEFEIVK